MDFFQCLEKKQAKTAFLSSSEMKFFLDNSGLLGDFPMFSRYGKAQKSFDVIRANIIIRSIINKSVLEDAYDKALKLAKKSNATTGDKNEIILTQEGMDLIRKAREKLPYFEEGENRIYIPILSRSINKIYAGDITKLSSQPFRSLLRNVDTMVVDPFDMYGDDLFDSYFTKLISIQKTEKSTAFWDYDAACIYIVNKQGRLDVSIALFDRSLKAKKPNHMMARIVPCVEAFYRGDKEEFQKLLVDNQLISSRLLYRNRFDERRLSNRMRRKYLDA